MKSLRFLVLAAALVLSYAVAAAAAPVNCTKKIESFDFVVDYSGSMMMKNTKLKKDKILVAKDIMHRINADIPNQQFNAGLHTISPNGTILKQGPWDRATMDMAIDKLKSNFDVFGRMTYMGDSLSKYQSYLSSLKRDAAIILFTDGGNNTGMDLAEVARQIYAQQRNLPIHIVDFSETPEEMATVKALAALNPNAQCVRAEALAKSDADLERFVIAVFCGQQQKTESAYSAGHGYAQTPAPDPAYAPRTTYPESHDSYQDSYTDTAASEPQTPAPVQRVTSGQLPPYILKPESYDDVQMVIRRVRTNQPVVLVLTDTPMDTAKRAARRIRLQRAPCGYNSYQG